MSMDASGNATAAHGLDLARITMLIDARFPQIHSGGRTHIIEEVGPRSARVRMKSHDRHLRPGGTVSGPAMFSLVDFGLYVAIIASIGESGLDAVTTNLNINFLTKPEPRDLVATVRLIRLGRRLAVGEVEVYADGLPEMVAHGIGTYALPPASSPQRAVS